MSSALVINSAVLAFVPSGSDGAAYAYEEPEVSAVDVERVERELRAELEVEFGKRLEREVIARVATERQSFNQRLMQYTANFDACVDALRKEIQVNVVELSLSMAEVIVRHELPDREMLHNLIVKTLEPVSDLQGATVRVSSHDWDLFGDQISAGDHLGVGSTVQFAEDPNLQAGDVIVESRNGIFDARLDERLKLLKESLDERSAQMSVNPVEL